MMRKFISALISLYLTSAVAAQERVVNVYNWSDYIDPKVLTDFTKETGVKVVYDTYDSNETLETKLLAGKTGYDVVVPSAPFMQRQIQAGVYQKLDRAKLPNARGLSDEVMARMAAYDPGNQYAVNYMWYATGIAFNAKKAQQVFGRPYVAPPGVPAEQVKMLRDAFEAVMKDEAFLADAKLGRLDISPLRGEKVQDVVAKLYAAPKDVVQRAKQLITP